MRRLTVILGRTYAEAREWRAGVDEEVGLYFSAHEPLAIRGLTAHRVYVAPGAETAPFFDRALAEVRRALVKVPDADEDVIYLKEACR